MSSYIYEYEDEVNNRYIKAIIDYEVSKGDWEEVLGGYSYQRCWMPGEITINSVRVLLIEYFGIKGTVMLRLKRPMGCYFGFEELERELIEQIEEDVSMGGMLYDDLREAAQ